MFDSQGKPSIMNHDALTSKFSPTSQNDILSLSRGTPSNMNGNYAIDRKNRLTENFADKLAA